MDTPNTLAQHCTDAPSLSYTYSLTIIISHYHTYIHTTTILLSITKSLSENKLGDAAGKAIFDALQVNTSIKKI